jgi:hypothetical protein
VKDHGDHQHTTDETAAHGWTSVSWSAAASATLHCLTGCAIAGVCPRGRFPADTPVNRWMISRGRGHAVVHAYHHH